MNTRMDRYRTNDETETSLSRVNKNAELYNEVKRSELSRVHNNTNVRVIEHNGKTIDLDKIRKYIEDDKPVTRERKRVIPESIPQKEEKKEESKKVYDINSVLEKARENRELNYENERYKKLRETEYDILSKIKMYEESELESKEEDLLNTEERTLVDLINTVTIQRGEVNLLEELMGEENDEVTGPIEEEVEKNDIVKELEEKTLTEKEITRELVNLKEKIEDIDKSFYTNSMSFSKEDFEGFEELEKSVKKSSVLTSVMIVLLVIFIMITLIFIANYVFDLGLF